MIIQEEIETTNITDITDELLSLIRYEGLDGWANDPIIYVKLEKTHVSSIYDHCLYLYTVYIYSRNNSDMFKISLELYHQFKNLTNKANKANKALSIPEPIIIPRKIINSIMELDI